MKKITLFFAAIALAFAAQAQDTYKVLKINKGTDVVYEIPLADFDSITFETREVETDPFNGHTYVDLGLPSGTLWATCNIGATSPEEYGDYFAWGETTTKEDYSSATLKYWNNETYTPTKYTRSDALITLEADDDAATANWGGNWRMPTTTEQEELLNECTWTWITLNGVKGCRVTGVNGNSIFLPAAGYREDSYPVGAGSNGYYWSSSLHERYIDFACSISFYAGYYVQSGSSRYKGKTIRPVHSSTPNVKPDPTTYVVSVAADATMGSVTGAGEYENGFIVTLTATPNEGYRFIGWNDGNTDNPRTIIVNSDTIFTALFENIPTVPTVDVTYELNGGITNPWGWTCPQDMYETLNADWNAFSGKDKVWTPLDSLTNFVRGIPTEASEMALDFLESEGFKSHFQWLIDYMDAKCTEQGQTIPSANASFLRYNLAAFFKDTQRTAWPVSANYTTYGVSNYSAYKDYWKAAFANSTQFTEWIYLNEPYRADYIFGGWYDNAEFTGSAIDSINSAFTGTLYAKWIENTPSTPTYVDLGLTSGTLWATCNIGATNPEDYGDYFAWGETKTKENYSWKTYAYGSTEDSLTKYCTNSDLGKDGFKDDKTALDTEDDAATAQWGGNWRMPTIDEQDELLTECSWTWITLNGVNGYEIKGKNGNSIFLPAAGYYDGMSHENVGSHGYYWSLSLNSSKNPRYSYGFYFYSTHQDVYNQLRYHGQTIRLVCSSKK